jgi:hypothetical protein
MDNSRTTAGIAGGIAVIALLLAVTPMLPPALAVEEPAHTLLSTASELFPPAFDPSTLLKWTYEVDPAISTEVIRESTVKKIGYGQTELVHVLETSSGTYSTDSLQDPHILYPGIARKRNVDGAGLAFWENGAWVIHKTLNAGSFVTMTQFEGGQLIVTSDGMCVTSPSTVTCN